MTNTLIIKKVLALDDVKEKLYTMSYDDDDIEIITENSMYAIHLDEFSIVLGEKNTVVMSMDANYAIEVYTLLKGLDLN